VSVLSVFVTDKTFLYYNSIWCDCAFELCKAFFMIKPQHTKER